MRYVLFTFLCLITSCASHSSRKSVSISFNEDLFKPVPFVENKSHLAMNVYYPAVEKIRQRLENEIGYPLKNRGEAHITILTPLEYGKLKNKISTDEIQTFQFRPVCIGRGKAHIEGHPEFTYYIVVDSPDLVKFRKKITTVENYYPHITLGFTKRDLHFEDGVIKNTSSCIENMNYVGP